MFIWKKILMILGLIAITIGLGFAIYYVFFYVPPTPVTVEEKPPITPITLPIAEPSEIKPKEEVTPITPTIPTKIVTEVPLPPEVKPDKVAKGGVTIVTDLDYNPTPTISLNSSGNAINTYNSLTGEFYKIDADGNKVLLTDKKFPDVKTIAWAPNTNKAILEFPDGSNILYDFENKKQITLPKSWTEFQFNSSESQIAFKDLDINPEKRFLGIANPDGSNQKYIEFLGYNADKVDIMWSPNNQVVARFRKVVSTEISKIYFIGQNQENFRLLEVNGQNISMKYTPTGDRLIYSAQNRYSGHKPVLYIVDADGDNIGKNHRSLNLNTWADKCTFADANTMYCAVPKELPEGAGWFPELADNIGDYIYRINLTNGNKSLVAEPQYSYNIQNLTISADGSTLFFTDKTTSSVHQIKLK